MLATSLFLCPFLTLVTSGGGHFKGVSSPTPAQSGPIVRLPLLPEHVSGSRFLVGESWYLVDHDSSPGAAPTFLFLNNFGKM